MGSDLGAEEGVGGEVAGSVSLNVEGYYGVEGGLEWGEAVEGVVAEEDFVGEGSDYGFTLFGGESPYGVYYV